MRWKWWIISLALLGQTTKTAARPVSKSPQAIATAEVRDTVVRGDTVFVYVHEPLPVPLDSTAAAEGAAGREISRYERRTQRYQRFWHNLTPNQFTVQYAGSIGLLSTGFGWYYGRHDNFETDILVGFLPRYNSEEAKMTLTLKQRFVPWHTRLGRDWTLCPLTTGIFVNTIFGEDFWANEPSRYPNRYYGFSTKIRLNVFLGQSFRYNIPGNKRRHAKALAFYYELSSCDLYIVSAFTNREIQFKDILSLALGLKFEIF